MPVALALGSFNLVGAGHLRALQAAQRTSRHLVIAVADDELVERRTGEMPQIPLDDRMELIEAFFPEAQVEVAVDDDAGSLVERFGADTIVVAHDEASPTIAPIDGVPVVALGMDEVAPLRTVDAEVLWLPRSG